MAVICGLIAALLNATTDSGTSANFSVNVSFPADGISGLMNDIADIDSAVLSTILIVVGIFFLIAFVFAIGLSIISGVVNVGYARFNLEIIDKKEGTPNQLFSYFRSWKTIFVTNLLKCIYVFLWSLLFVIPGIIAAYSYAMTSYILAENPELTAREALNRSQEIMRGNRLRLFFLWLSFIGWEILGVLSLGVGLLWVVPYKNAATADFYREISGTRHEFNTAEATFNNPEVI